MGVRPASLHLLQSSRHGCLYNLIREISDPLSKLSRNAPPNPAKYSGERPEMTTQ
jgi:hypothetical protein